MVTKLVLWTSLLKWGCSVWRIEEECKVIITGRAVLYVHEISVLCFQISRRCCSGLFCCDAVYMAQQVHLQLAGQWIRVSNELHLLSLAACNTLDIQKHVTEPFNFFHIWDIRACYRGFAFSNTPRSVGGMNNICMDWIMLRLVQTQMICSTFQARGLLVPNVIHSSYVTDASIGIAFCVLLFILPSRRPNYLCFRKRAGAYSSNMEKRTSY